MTVFEHDADERARDERVEARRALFHRTRVITALYLPDTQGRGVNTSLILATRAQSRSGLECGTRFSI